MMSCEHKQLFWWDGHMMCHMTTMLSHMTTAHMYVHHWYINIVKELRVELDWITGWEKHHHLGKEEEEEEEEEEDDKEEEEKEG